MTSASATSSREVLLSQREVALIQLERAIKLFLNERDFISVVTLACAAECILGEHLKEKGQEPHVEQLKAALRSSVLPNHTLKHINDEYVNRARNFFKHKNRIALDERQAFEPETDAICALVRSISNAALVTEAVSENAISFFKWLKANRPELINTAEFDHEFRV